jgi:hypothetical protein
MYSDRKWFSDSKNRSQIEADVNSILNEYVRKEVNQGKKIYRRKKIREIRKVVDKFFDTNLSEKRKRLLHNEYNRLINDFKNMYLYRF